MSLSSFPITQFVFSNGLPVANGWFTLNLTKDCQSPVGQVGTQKVTVNLDSTGHLIGSPLFWPNNQLVPSDSMYWLNVYDSIGELVIGPQAITVGTSSSATGFGAAFGASFGS